MIENAFDFEKIIQMTFKRDQYDVTANGHSNEPGCGFFLKGKGSKFLVKR